MAAMVAALQREAVSGLALGGQFLEHSVVVGWNGPIPRHKRYVRYVRYFAGFIGGFFIPRCPLRSAPFPLHLLLSTLENRA